MAKFKCNNCGNVFDIFCDVEQDSKNIQCPICSSHWIVVYNEEKTILPLPIFPHLTPHPYHRLDGYEILGGNKIYGK